VPTDNGSIDAYAAALTQLLLDISALRAVEQAAQIKRPTTLCGCLTQAAFAWVGLLTLTNDTVLSLAPKRYTSSITRNNDHHNFQYKPRL